MQSSAFTVCVRFRSESLIKIANVSEVILETYQDDQGRGIFYYVLKNDVGEEFAHFPFDTVMGWWRESAEAGLNRRVLDHQPMGADAS